MEVYVHILCKTNSDKIVNCGADNFDRLRNVGHKFSFPHVLMENDQLRHLYSGGKEGERGRERE